ncbi:MAG: hypothetical protein MJ082_04490 [Clostridia bacterium]|nr:hypothetical protein [Clostridia bacterium]
MNLCFQNRLRAECYLRFLHFSGIPSRIADREDFSALPVLTVSDKPPFAMPAEMLIASFSFRVGAFSLDEVQKLRYADTDFRLTKTQTRIVRTLILTYPVPISPSLLTEYCFLPEKFPEISALRSHLHTVNALFGESFSCPLAVFRESGYVLNENLLF